MEKLEEPKHLTDLTGGASVAAAFLVWLETNFLPTSSPFIQSNGGAVRRLSGGPDHVDLQWARADRAIVDLAGAMPKTMRIAIQECAIYDWSLTYLLSVRGIPT